MFGADLDDDDQQSLILVPSEDTPQPPKVRKTRASRKGKSRALPKSRDTVESGEEIDLTGVTSDMSESEAVETLASKKGGKKKKTMKASKHRLSAGAPTSPDLRKRTRTGSATPDESVLARATAAMQFDTTPTNAQGKAKELIIQMHTDATPTNRKGGETAAATAPSSSHVVATSQPAADVFIPPIDLDFQMRGGDIDLRLAALNEAHGQSSPGADEQCARAALQFDDPHSMVLNARGTQGHRAASTPLSTPPRTSPIVDAIHTPSPAPRRNEAIDSFSQPSGDRREGSSRPGGGLLGGAHPGVLGSGKDGSGSRGKVKRVYKAVRKSRK